MHCMCLENKEAGSLSSVGLFEELCYRSSSRTFDFETMEDGVRYVKRLFSFSLLPDLFHLYH